MAKSTKIILIVVVLVLAVLAIVYISKKQEDTEDDATGGSNDGYTYEDTPGSAAEPVKVKQFTAREQAFQEKVKKTNSLSRENVIKEARKSMLTGGLSGIVNSANNVTAAINSLFKKKK